MTNKEAIKVLENTKVMVLKGSVDELQLACSMAIKALEKQIPKKPVEIITDDNEYPYDRCPSCKRILYIGQPYCDKCGQAIDWSGSNATNN